MVKLPHTTFYMTHIDCNFCLQMGLVENLCIFNLHLVQCHAFQYMKLIFTVPYTAESGMPVPQVLYLQTVTQPNNMAAVLLHSDMEKR